MTTAPALAEDLSAARAKPDAMRDAGRTYRSHDSSRCVHD